MSKEIAEHRHRNGGHDESRISIIEAILLAMVALLAAWSGFAAAQWSTESRLELARSATNRTEASQADLRAMESRNFDATTFDAWFTAYVADNEEAMAIAERRFRPEFEVAFVAWMATDPATNPDAPPGPTYMPEYEQPDEELADQHTEEADRLYEEGSESAKTADDYVRITVLLASVLFIVGISGQFKVRRARHGLVTVGGAILVYSVILLIIAPKP
ncbi:MAG TPA: hypothetical protein VIY72_15905 [Acidimicrobiales bacterium]